MNIIAKLSHLTIVGLVKEKSRLTFVGKTDSVEMSLTLTIDPEAVRDFRVGDNYDLYVGPSFAKMLKEPLQDAYTMWGEAIYTRLIGMSMHGEGDKKKVQRQVFKECFFEALRERLKDPEFRSTLRRDIEIADSLTNK